jgi:hypothetical protein
VIINGFKRDLDLSWLTDRQYIEEQLIRYFTPLEDYEDRGRKHFTGRFFEWHVARSDKLRFTESDLLAVQRLSITVPPKAAFDLLENRNSYFAELIAACWQQIGAAPDIRSLPDRDLAEGALFQLYWELRKFHNVGDTAASKLMATKFPAHIPIRDSRVSAHLGATGKWWSPIKQLICAPGVAETLAAPVLPGPHVELLRRLDVVLWMRS